MGGGERGGGVLTRKKVYKRSAKTEADADEKKKYDHRRRISCLKKSGMENIGA